VAQQPIPFAKNIMTNKVITVENNVTSAQLMKLITEHHIRHVPITRDGKLVGIVSIGDVVKRLYEKYATRSRIDSNNSSIHSQQTSMDFSVIS
jgi:CBS domain-containing protein